MAKTGGGELCRQAGVRQNPAFSEHRLADDSAAQSASFNSQAAAVGIRGTAGAEGIPGAEGRTGTGSSRLFGLWDRGEKSATGETGATR